MAIQVLRALRLRRSPAPATAITRRVGTKPSKAVWRCFITAVLIGLLVGTAENAKAYKIETHVWIAQQVLNDLFSSAPGKPSGTVTIQFVDPKTHEVTREYFKVHPGIVASLAAYNNAYRLGSIGPDAFPDLIGGQMTTHPGIHNYWQTDDWLKWILTGAKAPMPPRDGTRGAISSTYSTSSWTGSESYAFAYGYLTHAASDIFAHSYVNTYAGDIFLIDRQKDPALEVEARHVLIEGYIRNHTPAFTNATGSDIGTPDNLIGEPPAFLKKRLILNKEVADQYRLQGSTHYLASMYDFWDKQQQIIDKIDAAKAAVDAKIAQLQSYVDGLKNAEACTPEICLFGHCTPSTCFNIYPAYCFFDPGTCLAVWTTEGILSSLKIASSATFEGIRLPMVNWHDQVEQAVGEYIKTSGKVAKELMRGDDGHPKSELAHWAECWTPAFAGIHEVITQPSCEPIQWSRQVFQKIQELCGSLSSLKPALWVVAPPCLVQEEVERLLSQGVGTEISQAIVGNDSLMTTFVQLDTENASENALTTRFSQDTSTKHLLIISDIVQRLNADMHTSGNNPFDPNLFSPMFNAVQLSKLVLLGPDELNRLAHRKGITRTIYGEDMFQAATPFNILFGAVRSIDGNQQWQEGSIPYPRIGFTQGQRNGLANAFGNYGYPYASGTSGFRLWQDCETRENVFKQIFRGPIAVGIEDPAQWGLSPLLGDKDPNRSSLENPFPLSNESVNVTKMDTSGDIAVRVCGGTGYPIPQQRGSYLPVVLGPDTTAPVLTAPPDITVQCAVNGGRNVDLGDAIVSDNRDHDLVATNNAPSVFPIGTTIVTWKAVDAAGNATERQQRVTVNDTLSPVFGAPPALLVVLATNPSGTAVPFTPPVANDACDGNIAAAIAGPIRPLSIGIHTIHWEARDRAGNVAGIDQQVTTEVKRGDLNVDGKVDNTDLQILIAALGTRLIAPAGSCDINGDGIVDQNEGQVCALSQNGETDRRDLIKDGALNDRDVAALVSICVSTGCDTTAPSIVLQNPRNAAYILNQVVLANYACSDAWGIGTCAGSVASGARIDTASVGTKSFAVNAVDTTGHQASQAVSYSVSYDVCQLYESTRVGTTGSTIPLKLRLCDAASVNRSSAGIVVKAIQLKKQGTSQIIDLGLGSNFTFDATIGGTGGGYVFNVITKGLSAGTYSLIFKAGNDPMTHEAEFTVR